MNRGGRHVGNVAGEAIVDFMEQHLEFSGDFAWFRAADYSECAEDLCMAGFRSDGKNFQCLSRAWGCRALRSANSGLTFSKFNRKNV